MSTAKDEVQALLDNLPEKLAKSNLEIADLPSASWDDVAGLLTRALRGGQANKTGGKIAPSTDKNINALTTILKKLELDTEDSKSREALKLLLKVIDKPAAETEEEGLVEETLSLPTFPDKPTVSIRFSNDNTEKRCSPNCILYLSSAAKISGNHPNKCIATASQIVSAITPSIALSAGLGL